jgi:hypothetical protein
MKTIWFKRTGFLYMPVHLMGALVTLIAAAVSIFFFIAIDRQSHSVSDTLIEFFVYFTCTAFWWKWIAEKTSN